MDVSESRRILREKYTPLKAKLNRLAEKANSEKPGAKCCYQYIRDQLDQFFQFVYTFYGNIETVIVMGNLSEDLFPAAKKNH